MKEENTENKLPFGHVEPRMINPKVLVLIAHPKIGKTTVASLLDKSLPGSTTLHLDFEEGTKYIGGNLVRIVGWTAPKEEKQSRVEARHKSNRYYMSEVLLMVREAKFPYTHVVVDTVTTMEQMLLPKAASLYKQTGMGKNWKGKDVQTLPQGAGYLYFRKALRAGLNEVMRLSKYIVLLCHVKDSKISGTSTGAEDNWKSVNLTGKNADIVAAEYADALGYLYREKETGALMVDFAAGGDILNGSRVSHLAGENFKLADYNPETKELENVRWDKIYLPE